jgi:hypothetical protein
MEPGRGQRLEVALVAVEGESSVDWNLDALASL